jgi:hypothetical protein
MPAALRDAGWEQRLAPLAQHMAQQQLVRAARRPGGSVRPLDLERLRTALCSLVHHHPDRGYLVVELTVEGREPAQVATERGTSRPALVEMLRCCAPSAPHRPGDCGARSGPRRSVGWTPA